MVELEQQVVGVLNGATAFLDLGRHRPRHDVPAREILRRRRIALHEALAVLVEKIAAFAPDALGDQHAGTGHAGRVELPELHVLEWDSRPCRHAHPVAGTDERVRRRGVDPARPAGREQRRARLQQRDLAGLHLERGDAEHVTVGRAHEVERHPLDEELRVGADVALVERVQHRVAGAVGRAARALHRRPRAHVHHVSAERALVDRAVVVAVERHAEVLELVHQLRCFPAHELDRVLVAQPVGALHRVVHAPLPRVRPHVAERGADPALRGYGVRTRGKHLRQHGDPEPGFGELQRAAQARPARADDDRVELPHDERHRPRPPRHEGASPLVLPEATKAMPSASVSP